MQSTIVRSALFTLSLAALAQIPPADQKIENQRTAKITFLVVDESGRTLSDWKVTKFKPRNSDKDFAAQFTGLVAASVPRGFYEYRLAGPVVKRGGLSDWTPRVDGRVDLYSLPEYLEVRTVFEDMLNGVAFDSMRPYSFVIRGKIDPMPPAALAADPLRVHVNALDHWSGVDVLVDPNGEFRIYQSLSGRYILTVIRGSEVLGVRLAVFSQSNSTSFTLSLDEKSDSVIQVR